jgi:hypothetical protein
LLHILAYLLWLVSIAACVVAFVELTSAITAVSAVYTGNTNAVRLIGQVSLLVFGLAAFIYVVFLQGYYAGSVKENTALREGVQVLLRRFAITIAIPLTVLVLALVALEVTLRTIH